MRRLLRGLASISLALYISTNAIAQNAGAVTPSESKFRIVKAASGSKGEDQAGRFVILDPRTIFYIPDDKKVIAYFEWDGPLGPHHFEGLWKNPDGKITVVSDFKYEAKQKRFAGIWELLLSDTIQPGLWTIEARIDGESAGTHVIQVISAVKPAIAESSKKLLSLADLYKKATAATVKLENLGATGAVQREGLGFYVDDGSLLTAFQVIDGANRVRVTPASGTSFEIDQLTGLQRREDWAVLKADLPPGQEKLLRADPGAWAVGEHCLTLNLNDAGALTLVDAQITGIQKVPDAGERVSINNTLDRKAVGSPLFNEYGEAVGIIGGVPFPGAFSPLEMTYAFSSLRQTPFPSAAIPISQVKTGGQPTPFAHWAANRTFMPAVVPGIHISRGAIAKKVEFKNSYPDTQDERFTYKRTDTQVTALIIWRPQKKLKASVTFRLFGSNNQLLMESKPGKKISFDPNTPVAASTWPIPLTSLASDLYRVDLSLDADVVWRAFFRVSD